MIYCGGLSIKGVEFLAGFLYGNCKKMIFLCFILVICGRCNVTEKNCKVFDKIMFVIYLALFVWACFIS